MHSDDEVGMQPERTGLSWTRTLISFAIVVGLLGAHAYHHGRIAPLLIVAMALALALVIMSSPMSHWRMRVARRHMEHGSSPLSGGLLLVVSAAAVAASITGLFIVVWTA
jgi:uncharacterized membrane protein YidH (DUF202 family)